MLLVIGMYIGNAGFKKRNVAGYWYVYRPRIGFSRSDYDRLGRDRRRPRGPRVKCQVGKPHNVYLYQTYCLIKSTVRDY